jgi:peptide/nickel transport system permease protein
MTTYLVRRSVGTIPVIVLITLLVFVLLHLTPGDPATLLIPPEATAADVAEARHRWGLDQPVYLQYLSFLSSAARGDLGQSFRYAEPVTQLIGSRLPATAELATLAVLIAAALAIPLGVVAGARPNSWLDNLGTTLGLFGISMPSFWFGIMLILLFAGLFHLLPSAGRNTYGVAGQTITGMYVLDSLLQGNWAALADGFQHMLLPAIALGSGMAGILMRVTRSSVLEATREDFVLVARAKGLTSRTVLWRHVLRNALIPMVTVVGLETGQILSGSIIVESVFAWPGLGTLLVSAIGSRDYPLVIGLVLFYTLVFVLLNLLIDALYAVIDPRITY